ncbi:MAG TPA: transposase [Polyangia bacterium]|nr:transposase [Polyangia bacterium]
MGRARQLRLALPDDRTWGGRRRGAGRRLVAERRTPAHRPRAEHRARWPLHVTWRTREAVPSLRSMRVLPSLSGALAASHKAAFRVVHFSVQTDHIHLIVEGDDRVSLVRGLQGLAVRCAKAVNRASRRRGAVWASRYHARALRTPSEARRGLVYVLLDFRKHLRAAPGVDPRSSGPWFDGWRRRDAPRAVAAARTGCPVVPAKTWLASIGWRRAGGRVALEEAPAAPHERALARGRTPPAGAPARGPVRGRMAACGASRAPRG